MFFTLGSSGIVWRYLSNALLNASVEHSDISLMFWGNELKIRGPFIVKLLNLTFIMRAGADAFMLGT